MNAKHTHHDEPATASDTIVDSTAPIEHAAHDHDGHMGHDGHDAPAVASQPEADAVGHSAHDDSAGHGEATDHPGSGAYVVHADRNPQADVVEPVAMDSHSAHVAPGHGEHSGHGAPATHAAHAARDAHAGHGAHVDHSSHEQVFRQRFWICLALGRGFGLVLLMRPPVKMERALPAWSPDDMRNDWFA